MEIELACISFISGKFLQYEYRLLGIDSAWIKTNTSKIEFNIPPYGNYSLEIKAIARWGTRSLLSKKLIIIHNAPFSDTTWFSILSYLFTGLTIGALSFLYYRKRQ